MPDATKVHIYDGATLKSSPTVDGGGNWSDPAVSLTAGTHTVNCKAEDAAGNIGSQTGKKCYVGSTTTPTCDLLDDSGSSSTDNITNDNTPRIDATVDLATEGTALGITVSADSVASLILERSSDSGTTWTQLEENTSPTQTGNRFYFTHQITVALADGAHKFRAAWKDAEGNQSSWGTVLDTTIDTAAPSAPTVNDPTEGQVFVGTSIGVSGTAA